MFDKYFLLFTIDSGVQQNDDRLGGRGIAAVVVVSLLMVIAVVVLVVFIGGSCYLTKYKMGGVKRSGKYAVDNTDIDGVLCMTLCVYVCMCERMNESVTKEVRECMSE